MSSASAVQPTPSASSTPGASRWGPKPSEPGSALGGFNRGKGRGSTRGGGRGGRGGGRSGFRGAKSQTDAISDKTELPLPKPEAPIAEKSTSSVLSKSSALTATDHSTSSRSKPPSRRASRTVPSLVIAPSPSVDGPPSGRSPNRRKRSGTNGKSPSSAGPKSATLSGDEVHLRPGSKGRPSASKDLPPHLRQSQNMKSDIDALVERVRAVAMAENRPATPGTASHIDWAGDDDDTLPDLDDWGVTTATSRSDKPSEISPIFVDGLRPLPEPMAFPVEAAQETSHPAQLESSPTQKHSQDSSSPLSDKPVSQDRSPIFSKATVEQDTLLAVSAKPSVAIPAKRNALPSNDNPRGFNKKPTRHPLPPKPIAVADTPISSSKLPPSATPMRGKFPKPSPQEKPSKHIDAVTVEPPTPKTETDQPVVKLPDQGLGQSIHAPSPAGSTDTKVEQSPETGSESTKAEEDAPKGNSTSDALASMMHAPKPDDSLSASIHAPKPGESLSAPGSATFDSFKPTHARAHTVGRTTHLGGPQRFPRSTATSPRSPFAPHHARNHSSPPAGASQRAHASRPVITGEAISRLARTIGTVVAPSRTHSMPASKD